jgi:glycosyltransferase involved in cell wall biosynthesis
MSVSVIIPTYNRCQQLRRALRSVLAQTRQADEVIVLDDGSTDTTPQILRSDFSTVKYHYQQNQGVSVARNQGIALAKSEWLAFLDSDDEWLPTKLEQQLNLLKTNQDMVVCHTDEIWMRKGKRVNAMKKHAKKGGWIFQHCLPLCAMSPSSIIIHRSVFEQTGLFDVNLPVCEDYDLWLRITARYPVLFIETPLLIKYGGHDDQLSTKYWGMDRFRIQAIEKIISSDILSLDNRQAAIDMLIKKAAIFLQGAKKRGKDREASYYELLINRYTEL